MAFAADISTIKAGRWMLTFAMHLPGISAALRSGGWTKAGDEVPQTAAPRTAVPKESGLSDRPTVTGLFKAWLHGWKDWEINPVLLKELRQSMRSRVLVSAVIGMLSILFLVTLFHLVRRDFMVQGDKPLGIPVFESLLVVLSAATLFFVPLFVGTRLGMERKESDLDLMFITSLPSTKIVAGKLFAGAYLALMLFSACAPFMTLANLLRGVDLPMVFFILFCLFWMVCLTIQAAILFACLPFPLAVKVLIGVVFAGGLALMTLGLLRFFSALLRSGIDITKISFWCGFVVLLLLTLGMTGLLFVMSVSLVTNDKRPRGYYNELVRPPAEPSV